MGVIGETLRSFIAQKENAGEVDQADLSKHTTNDFLDLIDKGYIIDDFQELSVRRNPLSPRERALVRLGHNSPDITPAERLSMLNRNGNGNGQGK